jgi:ribosome-associated protein
VATRDDLSGRQLAQRAKRLAGDRSAQAARELMGLADSTLAKLELDEELHDTIAAARAVTSRTARRRAERALAGALRGVDVVDLRERIAKVRATGTVDSDRMRLAEQWRVRLLEEGLVAIAEFPGGDPDHELPRLIAQAQREKASGKPPGAARALFRHIVEALKAREAAAAASDDESDDDAGDDDDD